MVKKERDERDEMERDERSLFSLHFKKHEIVILDKDG